MVKRRRLYYPLSQYLKERFNTRVYKITIDAGFTCPTRDGTKGEDGCIYCDAYGSGNRLFRKKSIEEQIESGRKFLAKRYKAEKFLVYFQAFTNTYASTDRLKKIYDKVKENDKGDIVGIIIGTRPDCIDSKKLELISTYTDKYEVWIEYGLQSIHKESLKFIGRGHTVDDYINAVALTHKYPLKITTHIIVGLPTETPSNMLETAKFVATSGYSDAIKIHSLYIPKSSRLAIIYEKEKFRLLSLDEYVEIVANILEILPENMVIARLTGETRKDELIAPVWVLKKQIIIRKIVEILQQRNSYQGKYFEK